MQLNGVARDVNGHPLVKKERFATQKELVRMAQLAGDCSKVFPPDFAAINVQEIMQQVSALIAAVVAVAARLTHSMQAKEVIFNTLK